MPPEPAGADPAAPPWPVVRPAAPGLPALASPGLPAWLVSPPGLPPPAPWLPLLSPLPAGCGQPWGEVGGAADPVFPVCPDCPGCPGSLELEPDAPPGDCCGGNGDSLPLLPLLGLELGLVPGLPPELDGEEAGGDELGGCELDEDEVAQPASAAAQAAVSSNRAMSG